MKKTILVQFILSFVLSSLFCILTSNKNQQSDFVFLETKIANPSLNINEKSLKSGTAEDINFKTQSNFAFDYIAQKDALQNAWNKTKGEGVKIAVIDTGIDIDNPDFKDKIDINSAYLHVTKVMENGKEVDLVDPSFRGGYHITKEYYRDDPSCIDHKYNGSGWDEHGTAVASIATAAENDFGVVGIAPESELLVLKYGMDVFSMAECIDYAVEQGADIINISSVASSHFDFLQEAINDAYEQNVIVIAAAGNATQDLGTYANYPACHDHVICVGSLDTSSTSSLASYTNFGEEIDILAPGTLLIPTLDSKSSVKKILYGETIGTSLSAPIIAGAAALWKSINPAGTVDDFERDLKISSLYKGRFYNQYLRKGKKSSIKCGILSIDGLLNINNEPLNSVEITLDDQYLEVGEATYFDIAFNPINTTDCNYTIDLDQSDVIRIEDNIVIALKKGTVNVTLRVGNSGFVHDFTIYVGTFNTFKFIYYNGTTESFELSDEYDINDFMPQNSPSSNDGYTKVEYEWVSNSERSYIECRIETKVSTTYSFVYLDGSIQKIEVPLGGNVEDFLPKNIWWEKTGETTYSVRELQDFEIIIIDVVIGVVVIAAMATVMIIVLKKKKKPENKKFKW